MATIKAAARLPQSKASASEVGRYKTFRAKLNVMKIRRRLFAFLFFASALAALAFTGNVHKPSADDHYLVLVGTYTNRTSSKGIYAFDFDSSTGTLTPKGLAAETPDPSWVVIHPNGKFAYAANESGKQSTITAFALDAQSAKLTQLNQLPSLGEDPCYLSFDKTGKFLFVANYSSGTAAVFPILSDGKLGEHTAVVKDAGTLGPNKKRQEAPHAHWIEPAGNNLFVWIADLGLDRILIYKFDAASGSIAFPDSPFVGRKSEGPYFISLPPGTGPRHVAEQGRFTYVVGELQSTVTAFYFDMHLKVNTEFQSVSTLPAGFTGRNDAAEIGVHPSGKWLFASNRGHDSIAVFAIDPASGKLRSAGDFPTGGKEPRHFAIDPTGRYLLAENQYSNSIVVFRIDPATGALTQVSRVDDIPSPVCLAFLVH
jgi:6-phosphogluconolactonase